MEASVNGNEPGVADGFKHWCIMELFGHQMIAGMVSEQQLGGTSFIRVDVPEAGSQKSYTKLYHHNAIYAITPTDEGTAKAMVASLNKAPIEAWHFRQSLPAFAPGEVDIDDEDNDDWGD